MFAKANSICQQDEDASVAHFFHILDSVAMLKGSAMTEEGAIDTTIYSSCVNVNRGIYYYKTYDNNQITAVFLNPELSPKARYRYIHW